MRVIAGKARGLKLKTIEGAATRPTTDRIKETLFNMLQPYMADCRFLDLFAGSGAIGIEALSRGADFCVFVELRRKTAACIQENLRFTKLEGQASVMITDAVSAVRQLDRDPKLKKPFDCIFMDPPYNMGLEMKVLEALGKTSLADANTLIVIEASLDTQWDGVSEWGYTVVKQKIYKTNQHVFLKLGSVE